MPVLFEQFSNCFEGNDDLSMNAAKRPKICAQSNEEFYTSKKMFRNGGQVLVYDQGASSK